MCAPLGMCSSPCGVWCDGCVWQLLNAGFVCKENFDRDDVDKYEEEKVSQPQPTTSPHA